METTEERQAKRRAPEPCSDINDIKLSDVTEHLRREIDTATKKSIEQMDVAMTAFHKITIEQMHIVVTH